MVRIETMTLSAILRAGMPADKVAPLVRLVMHGKIRAARLLEIAVGGPIHVTLPGIDEPCPLRHVNDARRRNGIVYARVDLGGGMHWEDDTLHGSMPDQLRSACLGRQLSDVIGDDSIDPRAVVEERSDGLFGVKRMTSDLPPSSLRAALAVRRDIMQLFLEDGRIEMKPPRSVLVGSAAMAALVTLVAAWRWTWPDEGTAGSFSLGMLTFAAAFNIWVAVNLRRRRPFSLLHAAMADARHRERYLID